MQLSKNKHIFSNFLMATAILKIIFMMVEGAVRTLLYEPNSIIPQMYDMNAIIIETACSALLILTICMLLYDAGCKIKRIKKKINSSKEPIQMAMLPEEAVGDDLSLVTVGQIELMLYLWGFILIVMQVIYELSSWLYSEMITKVMVFVDNNQADIAMFTEIYNSSHGFKYVGMVSAIVIGIFVSGLFLKDKKLIGISGIIIVLFMVVFGFIGYTTVEIGDSPILIVWTSILFHVLETAGLFTVALYIRAHNKGM